jgi:hypothetical protein
VTHLVGAHSNSAKIIFEWIDIDFIAVCLSLALFQARCFSYWLLYKLHQILRSRIFSWAVSHICACMYLNLKVVDVFSFYLQIFHWFIVSPSCRYFQGHSP